MKTIFASAALLMTLAAAAHTDDRARETNAILQDNFGPRVGTQ